jgi:zinc protease
MMPRRPGVRAAALAVTLLAAAHPGRAQSPDTAITYEVNGLQIIHQPRPSTAAVFAVQLYLLGGSRQVTGRTAGVEPFLLMASQYGTTKYPGEAARRALAETGSTIHVETTRDWTSVHLAGIKAEFDSAWAVFADRIMQPTLDSAAVHATRSRLIARATRQSQSPEARAWFVAESLAYRGHPYAADPDGTVMSLRAISADDLRAYAKEQLTTSRMLLVVVGDIAPDRVRDAVGRTLGTLPRGSYTWSLPDPVLVEKPELVVVSQQSITNYIVGFIAGPPRTQKDYFAFQRAMMLLSGWVSYEVREKNALSYAAYVTTLDRGAPGAAIYMSTTRADSAMRVVHRVLRSYEQEVSIPRSSLRRNAEWLKTQYLYGTESAADYARTLARARLYDGDHRAAAGFADIMMKLSFGDLRAAVRKYVKNIQFAYVGDGSRVTATEFTKR